MKALVTGAFGNIGTSVLMALVERGHHVTAFDVRNKENARTAKQFGKAVEIVWGDLRKPADVWRGLRDQDVVVHLAFVIPAISATGIEIEGQPDRAREINVDGTRNLLHAMKALARPPRILFASSYHIYGLTQDRQPPRTADEPVEAIDHYTRHKIECERMVRTSGLRWMILRFAAALPLSIKLDGAMFDIPPDNRMEFVHTRDVGVAVANAVGCQEAWGKVLLIGGGEKCQYYYRDIAEAVLEGTGVGMLPEEAFGRKPFATDWIDTSESERLLHYQQRDIRDYVSEMRSRLGFRRFLIWVFRPLVREVLLAKSPYARKNGIGWAAKLQQAWVTVKAAFARLELQPSRAQDNRKRNR